MPRTRRELIDAVIDNLGVLVPGQSPGDEAVARVDDHIDPGLATLAALGIAYVPDPGVPDPPTGGEIDDAIFLPLADWMAWAVAGGFNLSDSPSLKAAADQAEEVLRIISRPAATRKTLRVDGQLRGTRTRSPIGNFSRGT
jgi:hypothetical protein